MRGSAPDILVGIQGVERALKRTKRERGSGMRASRMRFLAVTAVLALAVATASAVVRT